MSESRSVSGCTSVVGSIALALHPTLDLTLSFLEIWHCPVLACLSLIHPLWGFVGSMLSKPGEASPRYHIARASFMGHFRFSFSLFVWFFYRGGARRPTAGGKALGRFCCLFRVLFLLRGLPSGFAPLSLLLSPFLPRPCGTNFCGS
ncbi:hypothetical protein B0T26DRAFT_14397 [Lasiosphaeria miniovina]|uniref:Uncharacterized protein n=1 Tax=Lasiosphaeria miniovina TaxID=1954250 RepID=A0AA40BFM2_9PEZI|nr:uncharacterized protein B0T26DRAFT_14397 [Lasiosphaeria miniovina]KAK0733367.1 hypothetical protein B0T26DRAFT_14397 [Lasiosphaeria miniovina]